MRNISGKPASAVTTCHNYHALRKCTRKYKFTHFQEEINHIMYMDDINLWPQIIIKQTTVKILKLNFTLKNETCL